MHSEVQKGHLKVNDSELDMQSSSSDQNIMYPQIQSHISELLCGLYLKSLPTHHNEEPLSSDADSDYSPDENERHREVKIDLDSRRRKDVDKSNWKKNIRKARRLKGESYIGHRGVEKPARPLLPVPCLAKPKHKCKDLVNENDRFKHYTEFRNLSSSDEQRQYLLSHIQQKPKKRTTRNIVNSRKTYTCEYTFSVDGKERKVCREFFMATLNVTDAFMRSALKKRSSSGLLEKDKRGKQVPANKLPDIAEAFIRKHILSFPLVESHSCGASSSKEYLDSSLNLSIMHRMYKEQCKEKNFKPVSFEKYRQIFKQYNLSFFKPKKDQC